MTIIKNNAVVADEWNVLRLHEGDASDSVVVPSGKVLVPLPVWQCQHEALQQRTDLGLWLAGFERIEDIQEEVHRFPVIAVDFHKYTDGRGYTIAYRLRNQLKYRGELRAMGDVMRDQLFYMQRVGFDAFALKAGKDISDAMNGLKDFSLSYQASTDNAQPLYRRVERGVVQQ